MLVFKPFAISLNGLDLSSPLRISENGIDFWLTRQSGKLFAFYDECAHMGGSLNTSSDGFVCSVHGWGYSKSGTNINPLSPGLRQIRILDSNDGEVVLSLPHRVKKSNDCLNDNLNLSLSVLSHASVLFEPGETKLLFDPWLKGRAYYGSWQLFPDASIDIGKLSPDAIVITHPHPDHFHVETLNELNKSIPVYFPRFPSKIIENSLSELGFINIHALNWGQEVFFENEESRISLEFLKPRSFWEDSATLVSIWENTERKFNWLNLVDSGSVIDEFLLPQIDLLSSAFNQGASGYPLTWQHLSVERKKKLMKSGKANTQNLLINRALKLQPRYFLPFAGHWRLAMPNHQEYAQMIEHTNFHELEQKFIERAPDTRFLGIYPGESINFMTGQVSINREVRESIKRGFTPSKVSPMCRSEGTEFRIIEFQQAMSKLIAKSEIFGVEHVIFEVSASDSGYSEQFEFKSSRSYIEKEIYISVSVPTYILNLFAENKANFDHIAIGYWGEWSRRPDIYPSNFMRLLQVGSTTSLTRDRDIEDIEIERVLNRAIGDLIETDPIEVGRIMTRIGLPCASCFRSNSETLIQGLNIHQIDPKQVDWLLRELVSLTYLNE